MDSGPIEGERLLKTQGLVAGPFKESGHQAPFMTASLNGPWDTKDSNQIHRHLFIRDIHSSTCNTSTGALETGNPLFTFTHVRVSGLVAAIETVYLTLDDTTGTIQCVLPTPQPILAVGEYVQLLGAVSQMSDNRCIQVSSITRITDKNTELLHSINTLILYRDVYFKASFETLTIPISETLASVQAALNLPATTRPNPTQTVPDARANWIVQSTPKAAMRSRVLNNEALEKQPFEFSPMKEVPKRDLEGFRNNDSSSNHALVQDEIAAITALAEGGGLDDLGDEDWMME
ncbi:hypothetical protein HDU80_005745 [Chytriomyces hyalinus]|nr:hypothetical protein HDU80_005745 [Chytriomyces hyalinus]